MYFLLDILVYMLMQGNHNNRTISSAYHDQVSSIMIPTNEQRTQLKLLGLDIF